MKNKIIFLCLIGWFAVACNQEKTIEITPESLTENNLEICQTHNCPEITINYLQAQGENAISEKINRKITSFIISSLSIAEEEPTVKTIKEAATNFIESYNSDKIDFPDMAADYFAEISITELYNSSSHICLELRQYLYTGGAHGYGTISFVNIDPKTGNELTDRDIFKNKKEFIAFAEKNFRKQQNISHDQS